jgi:inner membrane protein
MFTAHAPSGYILAKQLIARWRHLPRLPISARAAIIIAVIGALAPDVDMLYFYLADAGRTHHHRYFTHWPIVWLSLIALSALSFRYARPAWKGWTFGILLFCSCAFLHLILDTLVGDIWWFAPFQDKPYALFTVPARFSPWWLNFFLHWSFIAEVLIWAWAIREYRRRP